MSARRLRAAAGSPRLRAAIVAAELALVLGLLAAWLGSEEVRRSASLWALFLYSFPSEFLVAVVPHEPALLHFGTVHPASVVALVAGVGTVLTEAVNYHLIDVFAGVAGVRRAASSRHVARLVALFDRAPFAALWVAGFTPIPFFPFRFLVVFAGYSRWRYLLAVAASRTPRFWLIAWLGAALEPSTGAIVATFVLLAIGVTVPGLWGLFAAGGRGERLSARSSRGPPSPTSRSASPRRPRGTPPPGSGA